MALSLAFAKHHGQGTTVPGALSTLLAGLPIGFGFAAAFGWLWFPSLRDVLLPGFFAGPPPFQPLVFGLALGGGCLIDAALGSIQKKHSPRRQGLNAILAHVLCLLLLALAVLCQTAPPFADLTPDGLPEVLAGLAAAPVGCWWFQQLLTRGPGTALAALGWSALTALLLSIPLARLPDCFPEAPPEPVIIFFALCAGIAAALLTALFLLREGREKTPDWQTPPDKHCAPGQQKAALFVHAAAAALLLFGTGSLNVYVHDLGDVVPAAAHVVGLALSACVLTGLSEYLNNRPATDEMGNATPRRSVRQGPHISLLAGACGLAIPSLCLPLFPQSARLLFPLCAALAEAACLALCASAQTKIISQHADTTHRAGFVAARLTLAALLLAVNTGYMSGATLGAFVGSVGPLLPGVSALLLLLLLAVACRSSGDALPLLADTEKDQTSSAGDAGTPVLTEIAPKIPQLHPAVAVQFTERERVLALLIVRGYSNKEASEALGLSENTVRWYIKKFNKKTGATDRQGLIAALLSD